MRVKERLQHGLAVLGSIAAFALAILPNNAPGQIITASEPYQNVDASGQNQEIIAENATATQEASGLTDIDHLFLMARRALAFGNVEAAEIYLNQAQSFTDERSQFGDSVQSIQAMIENQNKLAASAADKTPGYNQKAAEFLLQQASGLLKFKDFDTASQLVEQARKFPVDFTSLSVSPDAILDAINQSKNVGTEEFANSQLAITELLSLMSRAQLAFDQGDLNTAQTLTNQAVGLGIADTRLPANQVLPWQLELKIQDAMKSGGNTMAASFQTMPKESVIQADYDPENDKTRNVLVTTTTNGVSPLATTMPKFSPIPGKGLQLFESGMNALRSHNLTLAREFFAQAWQYRDQLDESSQQTLQDQLSNLPTANDLDAANTATEELPVPETMPIANSVDSKQNEEIIGNQMPREQFRKLQSEVFRQRAAAERIRGEDPRAAIEMLTQIRGRVSQSTISAESKRPLFTIIDRDIAEFQKFIEQNFSDIKLREDNAAVLADVRESREKRYNTELQIQKLVEEFNGLMDERRYAEANMVVRQVAELSPESEIVAQLKSTASIGTRAAIAGELRERKEAGFLDSLHEVDKASVANVNTENYLIFDDLDRWAKNSDRRDEWVKKLQYSSAAERKIWNVLKNEKVEGHYQGTLSEAIDELSERSGINIIIDTSALAADSLSSSSTVDVPIRQPISLQSALNVILGPLGLVFIVEDEVIKVTSRDAQRRDVKPKTYYVGDLVTPVQNFQNSLSMNFMTPQGSVGQNGIIGQGQPVPLANHSYNTVSPMELAQQAVGAGNVLGQRQQLPGLGNPIIGGAGGGGPQSGTPTYSSIGPQALGGVTEADFQPLISLIRNTIDPDGWDDTNGDGTVQAFVPNLSLIVSQTQEVQDQIQDLLQQLRELNDVQIVVEVRFVSLADGFFERIGIDFDFSLNDNSGLNPNAIPEQVNQSTVIGLQPGGTDGAPFFSADLDIPFQNTFFQSTIPQFGGFDPGTAANFGFAILSDIEVFFLIQASKGDTRTNFTQAPTVTMFNGQVASISDGQNVPFVTSVTPVVGDFAVAQQPIITLLPEGASLNVQAVVSNDRKSVRMTLVPFFSQITDVDTFTFDGTRTTQRATDDSLLDDLLGAAIGLDPDDTGNTEIETSTQGVTIQLPTLAFTSVSTVVSVPDGGTILLGGIKRQNEQRIERGVPFLSNVPYISRLFKNVGIGRDTSSLMMMVSPRIIIQEEEQEDQTGITN